MAEWLPHKHRCLMTIEQPSAVLLLLEKCCLRTVKADVNGKCKTTFQYWLWVKLTFFGFILHFKPSAKYRNQWLKNSHLSGYPAKCLVIKGKRKDWLARCRYTVTGWGRKFDLQLSSQCGRMYNCLRYTSMLLGCQANNSSNNTADALNFENTCHRYDGLTDLAAKYLPDLGLGICLTDLVARYPPHWPSS